MTTRICDATPALDALDMWVIYERPLDFPTGYVARLWKVTAVMRPTLTAIFAASLEAARAGLPPGLTRVARHPSDEPQIVEVWL